MILSCGVCLPALALGWIYERQNELPPAPVQTEEVSPANNAFDVLMQAIPLASAPLASRSVKGVCNSSGTEVDRECACNQWKFPLPYTPGYKRVFPLSRKTAFLQTNASALKAWRASLSLPLYVPDHLPRAQERVWRRGCRLFGVLTRIQARACWQRGDNDGALDWLLAWHRDLCRQTVSFYNGRPHPVAFTSYGYWVGDGYLRQEVGDELTRLMPYLNAAQLRRASLGLESNRALIPSRVAVAQISRKKWMARLYRACATNDLRVLDVETPSGLGSSILATRFRWANKRAGLSRIDRRWKQVIEQEKQPLPPIENQAPEDSLEEGDVFRLADAHPSQYRRRSDAQSNAREVVLLTAMAVHSFALEHRRNPRTLNELVPRFLRKIHADPCAEPRSLRYSPAPKTYIGLSQAKPIRALRLPPNAVPGVEGPSGSSGFYQFRISRTLPFLLYSVGENGHDEGGMNFEAAPRVHQSSSFYSGCDDILAPVEWFQIPK